MPEIPKELKEALDSGIVANLNYTPVKRQPNGIQYLCPCCSNVVQNWITLPRYLSDRIRGTYPYYYTICSSCLSYAIIKYVMKYDGYLDGYLIATLDHYICQSYNVDGSLLQ